MIGHAYRRAAYTSVATNAEAPKWAAYRLPSGYPERGVFWTTDDSIYLLRTNASPKGVPGQRHHLWAFVAPTFSSMGVWCFVVLLGVFGSVVLFYVCLCLRRSFGRLCSLLCMFVSLSVLGRRSHLWKLIAPSSMRRSCGRPSKRGSILMKSHHSSRSFWVLFINFSKCGNMTTGKVQMREFLLDSVVRYLEETGKKSLFAARIPYLPENFSPKGGEEPGVHAKTCSSHLMNFLFAAACENRSCCRCYKVTSWN